MVHSGPIAQVASQLQGAADVGAGHQSGTSAAEVIGLDPPELSGFIGLHQVVDAGTAAADARFRCFPELDLGMARNWRGWAWMPWP